MTAAGESASIAVPAPADALAVALAERGLLPQRGEPMPQHGPDRPWFVGAVLGVAGWLAGLFALGFVWVLFEPDTTSEYAVSGAVLLAAAIGLYVIGRNAAFLEQLALACSIAGQLAITGAAAGATESPAATAAIVAIMQIALLVVVPNDLARKLAALFACIAWAFAVRLGWWDAEPFDYAREQAALAPALLGWLVVWTPIVALTLALIATEPNWIVTSARGIVRPALSGLIAAHAVGTWASEPFAGLPVLRGEGSTSWLALWPLLGAFAALFAAYCAFRLRNRALIGLAIVGALLHVSQFYYVLGTTLVVKSLIMLADGCACLVAAWAVRRLYVPRGAPESP